jgi:hypothetical protein
MCLSRIHLPAFLCSTRITVLPRSYEGSDSSAHVSSPPRHPRFTAPELPCRSVSNHPASSQNGFLCTRSLSPSGLFPAAPFPFRAHRVSGLRHSSAGSPPNRAESSFLRTDRQDRLPLLSTPSRDDAVAVGFQPVECLVERVPTSFSGALSGARAPAACRPVRRQLAGGAHLNCAIKTAGWQPADRPASCRRSELRVDHLIRSFPSASLLRHRQRPRHAVPRRVLNLQPQIVRA